jgi:hypothetical protein
MDLLARETVEKVRNKYIRMLERYLTSKDFNLRKGTTFFKL